MTDPELRKGSRARSKITQTNPKYRFTSKNRITIYPTPDQTVSNGLKLVYNTTPPAITKDTNDETIGLPTALLHCIDEYLLMKIHKIENVSQFQISHNDRREKTNNAIYFMCNMDRSSGEENFKTP
jgi:hypothetical protein